MAKRWQLEDVRSLLDVGCGQCHWTKLISQFLSKGTEVTAVDADSKWANGNETTKEFFLKTGLSFDIKQASVLELPFADNSFDAVTCQTVLIHLENPLDALHEMKRVLKPNGILFCAEPNNLINSVIKDSITSKFEIEEIIEWFVFGLIKEKGKINLGNGDNSVGDLLPKLFSQISLQDIKTYISDKANCIIPPYESDEIKAMLNHRLKNDFEELIKIETQKQFETFDGKYEEIQQRVEQKIKDYKAELKDKVNNQTFYDASTALMYLISGRKTKAH